MHTRLRVIFSSTLAALCLLAAACKKSAAPPPRSAPSVTVNQPLQREVLEWDDYPGRLEAVDMVQVRARVNGYLESVHFKEGAEVKAGDLLFVIDPRPYQAEVNRTEAELRQAQTRAELASNDWTRAERLLKSKAISEEEADARNKAKRQAEAGIQSAQASVETAKLNLEYTHVAAPISGRISRKMVTEGNLINGNQGQATLLTTIVSLDPIYCYADVEEQAFQKYQRLVRERGHGSLREAQLPCELGLADEQGFPHHGVIDFVNNEVNPNTGTMHMRGVFRNEDRTLMPGFFARFRITASEKHPAILIPDQAVSTDQAQKFVYVVNGQNQVDYRSVKLGPIIDGLRVVREGIRPGDWVVVNGLMTIRPGMTVQPQKAAIAGSLPSTNPPAVTQAN